MVVSNSHVVLFIVAFSSHLFCVLFFNIIFLSSKDSLLDLFFLLLCLNEISKSSHQEDDIEVAQVKSNVDDEPEECKDIASNDALNIFGKEGAKSLMVFMCWISIFEGCMNAEIQDGTDKIDEHHNQ